MAETFKVKLDSKDVEFDVKSPSLKDQREGQKVYNQAFSDAVKSGSIVRAKLDDLLTEQGLWDDAKQARFLAIQTEINDGEKALSKGGITLAVARGTAIAMKKLRDELNNYKVIVEESKNSYEKILDKTTKSIEQFIENAEIEKEQNI